MDEVQLIEDKIEDLRKRYKTASKNKQRFYIVLANMLKEKQKLLLDIHDK